MFLPRPFLTHKRSALTAGSCAFLLLAGCSHDHPDTSSARSTTSATAVQASDTSKVGRPGESRVSMTLPNGSRGNGDLLIEETGPSEVRVGAPYSYQVRVTNLTDQPITGVMLQQRVPEDFKLTSNDTIRRSEEAPTQAQMSVGDLGPKESKTLTVTGTPSRPGTLDTCLSARYNPPVLCAHVAVVAPALQATAQGPSQVDVCQDIVYEYTVTNTGSGAARDVVLQGNLPQGLQTTDGQNTINVKLGDLAQGQSKNVTARLRASQAGKFASKAIVRSDAGEAEVQQLTTTVLAPRLVVAVTGPKEDYLGQPVSYQVTVKNEGDAAAADARVRVTADPAAAQLLAGDNSGGAQLASDRQGGQDIGSLAPGQSRTFNVNYQPQREGNLSVAATAQAKCAQPVTTAVETQVMAVTASAIIVTHDPDPVPVGNNVIYRITATNKGSATDHNVRITATLPPSEQFVRAGGQTAASNDGQNITFAPVEELKPKQTVTWQVEAKALRPDEAQFQASMVSESTPKAATKVEPTKLFGGQQGTVTKTKEADQAAPVNVPAPTPPGK